MVRCIPLGSTHVLLASLSNPLAISSLMDVLLPIIEDTLVVLDIHANMLREVPDALSRCRALEELNVSDNPIPAVPKWLGHLTELRVVLMDRCSLRTLPANMIAAQYLHTICSKLVPASLSAYYVPLIAIFKCSPAKSTDLFTVVAFSAPEARNAADRRQSVRRTLEDSESNPHDTGLAKCSEPSDRVARSAWRYGVTCYYTTAY